MPRIGFDPKHKRSSFFEYPKLKLEKNEKARVTIVESEPIAEFVHNLAKIILDEGRPIMKTVTYGKDGDKTKEVPENEFIGKFLCLGDPEVLDTQESDPDNCPACKAYQENSSAIGKPQRRIVFHILKYATKKGSFEISQPFQAQVLAWEMPDTRFGTLVDIASEHGDLRKIDLCLGPCTKPAWQTYDISPGATCVLADPDNRQRAAEILKENMAEDLTPLLGRKVTPGELQAKVNEILDQWRRGFGGGGYSSESSSAASTKPEAAHTELDFSSLIPNRQAQSAASPASASPASAPALADLAQDAAPAEAESEQKPVSKTDDIPDLESLLGNMR